MRIYTDICTLCRPFDDQTQPRIWLETHALCVILNLIELGKLEMVRSPIHELETARNPWEFRRLWVEDCLKLAQVRISLSPAIKQRAQELELVGVKSLDALHAASAEAAHCSSLITCDNRILKRYIGPLAVLNPAEFVVQFLEQQP